MKLLDVEWKRDGNYLLVRCDCGRLIRHRANQWRIRCGCGTSVPVEVVRQQPLPEEEPDTDDPPTGFVDPT